jgi:transposase
MGAGGWQTVGMARAHFKLVITVEQRAEVERCFRQTQDVRQRSRLQAVLLATRGDVGWRDVAQMVGCAVSTLQEWIGKYLAGGLAGLLSRKRAPGKASPMQAAAVQAQLRAGLAEGTWRTAGQVRHWLAQTHGIRLAERSVYYWLGKLQGVLRVPRPVHVKRDPAAAAAFRASLEQKLVELNLPRDRPVKVWVMDEARFGLHSHTRRCWGLRGVPVVGPRQHRYEWDYLYGALEVVGGQSCFAFLPTVGLELTPLFLAQIAATQSAAEHVVIYDRAGFHLRPGDARVPARVHLLLLPPYSPELNPVEGVWDYGHDGTCNRVFDTLDQLQAVLTERLRPLWEEPGRVLSLVHHWLHTQANTLSKPIVPELYSG